MFELSDPKMMWLTLINIALGIVTLACCFLIARTVRESLQKSMKGKSCNPIDDHMFFEPELGLTMADGGERINKDQYH